MEEGGSCYQDARICILPRLHRCKERQDSQTYDHMAFNVEEAEDVDEHEAYWTRDEPLDDDTIAVLASENDEDATLIMQFEDAVQHAVQSDPDLTVLFSSYQDARRRLTERVKFRGFWPVKKGFKGSGKKGGKSTGKGKLTLALKIANSHCRLCGQKGHWKAECSQRGRFTDPCSKCSSLSGCDG